MASTRETYCRWVINALRDLGSATPQQVYRWIRLNEAVQAPDFAGFTSDGENLFKKNVRLARWSSASPGYRQRPRGSRRLVARRAMTGVRRETRGE